MRKRRPARVADIALAAGVGTATVDRVLNGRGNVTEATAERVRKAMDALAAANASGAVATAQPAAHRFGAVLPSQAGASTELLAAALRDAGTLAGVSLDCSFVEKMNPAALARRLDEIRRQGRSGVAFQALDHPLVHDAVARLAEERVPVVTLMSDLGGSGAFVGMDNRAAGRTAGYLMGRFSRGGGQVAILWGGELYRSHEEREIGFRSLLRADFPGLETLDLVSGGDDAEGNYRQIRRVLDSHPDLVGIYSVGGGNSGVVRALKERGRESDVTLIGHNLTAATQAFLIEGAMDAVIHQDMSLAARSAVQALIALREERPKAVARLPIEIVTKENMLGRLRPAAQGEAGLARSPG